MANFRDKIVGEIKEKEKLAVENRPTEKQIKKDIQEAFNKSIYHN